MNKLKQLIKFKEELIMMTRENLQGMTVKELRGIVKERGGIQGCSKMNKEELIEAIYTDHIVQKAAEEVKETIHMIENNINSDEECDDVVEDIEETSETVVESIEQEIEESIEDESEEGDFYSDRTAVILKSSKVWGGQERVRYTCSHCGARIGNTTDHFCYNCGHKFEK